MKRVCVTGANGFIGFNLVTYLLDKDCFVYAVVHKNIEKLQTVVNQNFVILRDEELPSYKFGEKIDVFYNLAWVGAGGKGRADYVIQLENIKNTLKFYDVAEKNGCEKFISIGTIGEKMVDYAICNNIISQNFIYANCKSFAHKMLKIIETGKSCKVIWATLCGIFGIGDTTNNLINYTIKNLLTKRKTEYGSCEQFFDFIYITDCVRALFLLGENHLKSDDFYIGSGNPLILKEYLFIIKDELSVSENLGIGIRSDDGTRYFKEWFNIEALTRETNFMCELTFREGIRKTIRSIAIGV